MEYKIKNEMRYRDRTYRFEYKYKTRSRAYRRFFEEKNHPYEVETQVLLDGVDITAEFEADAARLDHQKHWRQGLCVDTDRMEIRFGEAGRD